MILMDGLSGLSGILMILIRARGIAAGTGAKPTPTTVLLDELRCRPAP
jgi:hypothetical protein